MSTWIFLSTDSATTTSILTFEVIDDSRRDLARNLGLDPLARATKKQYDRMTTEGLGDLDKSGIAELTFKDRHKHSGDQL